MTNHDPPPMSRGELQRRVVRGALWTALHTAISLPLAIGVNILIARVLGVADYGRLTFLTTVITIAGVIAGAGVTTAVIQFGAKAHAKGKTEEVMDLLSASQGFRMMVTAPLVGAAVLLLVDVQEWLIVTALVFGVMFPAALGNALPVLTIENRSATAAQTSMVANLVTQLIVVATVLTIGTADAVWASRVIASGALLALPLLSIASIYRSTVIRPKFPWRLRKSFWAFALPTGAAAAVGALTSNRIEVVFLQWFSTDVAMGLFGLAFGVAGHVYAPAQAFVGPLVPAVSALAEVDQTALRRAFMRTTRTGSTIGGLLAVGGVPTVAILVPMIYGDGYAPARDLVMVLGLAGAVNLVGAPHQAFLMARLGGRRILRIRLVTLCVSLSLSLLLIPGIGAWGATIACATALVVAALQQTLGEARYLGVTRWELLRNGAGLLVAMVLASLTWALARNAEMNPWVLAALTVVAAPSLYVFTLKVTKCGLSSADGISILSGLPNRLKPLARPLLSLLVGDVSHRATS